VIRSLLIVAGLSALDPCGLDGADDGGTVEAGPAQSVGTQCTAIDTEFCIQYSPRCGQGSDIPGCVAMYMPECCSTGNTCDQASTSSQSDVDACKADIDMTDCNFIVNGAFPPSCQGLLHP
jgi:hypothetical protein